MIDSLLYARHWSYVSVFLMRIDAYWRIELLYGKVSFHNLGRVLIKELVSMLCQDGVSVPRRAGDVGKADLLEPSLRDKSHLHIQNTFLMETLNSILQARKLGIYEIREIAQYHWECVQF